MSSWISTYTVQHYRGHNEHLIREMEAGKKSSLSAFAAPFPSSRCTHPVSRTHDGVTGAHEGSPIRDVYGPWPVVSEETFRAFPK
eukprot:1093096-Prymnesium_polylepis.1